MAENTKTCNKCQIDKNLDEFNIRTKSKDGFEYHCKECNSKIRKSKHNYITRPWSSNNDTKVCRVCMNNKDKTEFPKHMGGKYGVDCVCKICSVIKTKTNPKTKQYRDKFNIVNKDRLNQKAREWSKHQSLVNPQFRIKQILRGRLLDALKRHTLGGKVNKKHSSLILLGCTIIEFKLYIEALFFPEMNWSNHGTIWEIDHIKSCSSFDLTDLKQQEECFRYTNMQPLFKTTKIAESFGHVGHIGNRDKYNK